MYFIITGTVKFFPASTFSSCWPGLAGNFLGLNDTLVWMYWNYKQKIMVKSQVRKSLCSRLYNRMYETQQAPKRDDIYLSNFHKAYAINNFKLTKTSFSLHRQFKGATLQTMCSEITAKCREIVDYLTQRTYIFITVSLKVFLPFQFNRIL